MLVRSMVTPLAGWLTWRQRPNARVPLQCGQQASSRAEDRRRWCGYPYGQWGRSAGESTHVRTVLVVDDHVGFRSRARLLLEAEGYEVVGEAADGAGALAEAARLQPEIVLLDVQLPDLDGFDVAALLTENGDAPAVVLTSSRDWSDSAELIARSGARGFVPKDQLSGEAVGELVR